MDPRTDRWIGAALLIIAGYWAWQTALLDNPEMPGTIGPRVFPFILSGLLAVLALFLIAGTRRAGVVKQEVAAAAEAESGAASARSLLEHEWVAVPLTLGLLLIYVYLLPTVGFLLSTPFLMLVAVKFLLGETSWVRAVAVSVGVSLTIYLVFGKIFSVPLPVGKILG